MQLYSSIARLSHVPPFRHGEASQGRAPGGGGGMGTAEFWHTPRKASAPGMASSGCRSKVTWQRK